VNNDAAATSAAIAEGVILALHQDNRFKSEPEEKPLKLEMYIFWE
jgi:leucyl aminopeptidase